jgi:hypothetical protein
MTYRVRNPDLHQEEDLVPLWKVLAALALTAGVSAVLILWAVSATDARMAALRPSGVFPERWIGPRHMVAKVREDYFGEQRGRSYDGRKQAELDSYGWVDPAQGTVRIPIQRAIDLVVQEGQP